MKYQGFVKNRKIKKWEVQVAVRSGGGGGGRRRGVGIVSETFCMTSSLAHPSGRLAHYSN